MAVLPPLSRIVQGGLRRLGLAHADEEFPSDFEPDEIETYRAVADYTMTGPLRTVSLVRAVRYLVAHRIEGDVVECGVWKGGSMMAVARTLLHAGDSGRDLWLYDTFTGMAEPTEHDVSIASDWSAQKIYQSAYFHAPLEGVRAAIEGTGYDPARLHLIAGKVEETIPAQAPERIALLRLDTDWYESTKHELDHLFPRLVSGGVLIIDDYGVWRGARKATDEFLATAGVPMLLQRIDNSARIAVKP